MDGAMEFKAHRIYLIANYDIRLDYVNMFSYCGRHVVNFISQHNRSDVLKKGLKNFSCKLPERQTDEHLLLYFG
jgi:hypothetical protein